jgi:DNA-binding response OmpR family regulator
MRYANMTESHAIKGKRILLVEDERAVRETLRLLLARDAHTIVEANNGAEAFALFLGAKFDLVMTDFEMPFVKGDELATKIKRVAPSQPILMLTAFDHRADSRNPVDAVVRKPFDCARLRDTMTALLSRTDEDSLTPGRAHLSPSGLISEDETVCA